MQASLMEKSFAEHQATIKLVQENLLDVIVLCAERLEHVLSPGGRFAASAQSP